MISMIVCVDENWAIGYKNQLLCNLPKDLKHFKDTTIGKTVIMGRKTFESIGKPLPNRQNIVLTNQKDYNPYSVIVVNDIQQILMMNHQYPSKEFVVIGGESIYLQFLPYTSKIYLTQIHYKFDKYDAKFPVLLDTHWKEEKCESYKSDDNNPYDFTIKTFVRK